MAEWILWLYGLSVIFILGITSTLKVQGKMPKVSWIMLIVGSVIWPIALLMAGGASKR